jgi:hypothetical protein
MLLRDDVKIEETFPVVQWLLEQQNTKGGILKIDKTM